MHHSTKTHLLPLVIGTVLSAAACIAVITSVDPSSTGKVGIASFFLTFFLTTSGAASIVGLMIRKRFVPGALVTQYGTGLRQGVIIGAMSTLILLLQSLNILFWWVALPIILFVISIEIFFHSK